jgi:D-beta-D-heptose 7-phosphate kinase/D-beta-D-heptose 1-phosphate adenosyltransferase
MMEAKIKNIVQLQRIITRLKAKGKKIVFTNGCFDILHFGHAKYLKEAKRKGDVLVVGVNSDSSVRKIKGNKRPIINEAHRAGLIAALESVDFVVIFKEETPSRVIKTLKPDILVKGADWAQKDIVGRDFVLRRGGKVYTVKLVKGFSSTNLIKKIAKAFQRDK